MNKLTQPFWYLKNNYEKQKRNFLNKEILNFCNSQKIKGYDGQIFDRDLNTSSINNYYHPAKKILGLYEYEIKHFLINYLINQKFDNYLSLGASDGIESWRIANLLNVQEVSLYDTDLKKYKHIWENIFYEHNLKLNGEVSLNTNLDFLYDETKRTFALIDLEGFEFELLAKQMHNWSNCDLIIEIHTNKPFGDNFLWNKYSVIKEKKFIPIVSEFYRSHEVLEWTKLRLPFLQYKDIVRILYEIRTYSIGWIYLRL